MRGYGFNSSSRELIQRELGFNPTELTEIEEKLGFTLENTFTEIRQTEFDIEETKDTISQSKAVTKPEPGINGTEIVIEYENELTPETLAHEATHAKMMAPDGDMYNELPDKPITEQRMYSEFVAYLAEDQIEPLQTQSSELAAVGGTDFMYKILSKEKSGLTGDLETDYLNAKEKKDPAYKLQSTREDVIAQKAAEEYELDQEETLKDYLSPDENLYDEVTEHIENVESNVLQNYRTK